VVLHSIREQARRENVASSATVNQISLSGCVVMSTPGGWVLAPNARWHSVDPGVQENHREEFHLPPNITARFYHSTRTWFVPDPSEVQAFVPSSGSHNVPLRPRAPTMSPEAEAFVKVRPHLAWLALSDGGKEKEAAQLRGARRALSLGVQ
jgi:hypothetical protein